MTGVQDYKPVAVPPGTIELRIHGVSGTPPEALIKDTPILVAGTTTAGFYRHATSTDTLAAESPGIREGYAWGGLTSGSRFTSALRILLLPFGLVNVAGWMVPGVSDPEDSKPTREEANPNPQQQAIVRHTVVSRLLALLVTAYAATGALWLATIGFTQLEASWAGSPLNDYDDAVRAALGVVVVAVLTWMFVARRHALVETVDFAPTAEMPNAMQAPAAAPASASYDVSMLWREPDAQGRLSVLHFAVAISVGSAIATRALQSDSKWATLALVLATISTLLAVLRIFELSGETNGSQVADDSAAHTGLSPVLPWISAVSATLAAVAAIAAQPLAMEAEQANQSLVAATTLALVIVIVLALVLVVLQAFVGPSGGPTLGRWHSSAFTVIGFGTSFTGVVGLAGLIVVIAHRHEPALALSAVLEVVGHVAQSVAIVGFASVCATLIAVLLRLNVTASVTSIAGFTRLRETVKHARSAIVLGAGVFFAGVVAVGVIHIGVKQELTPVIPPSSARIAVGIAAAIVACAAVVLAAVRGGAVRIGAIVVALAGATTAFVILMAINTPLPADGENVARGWASFGWLVVGAVVASLGAARFTSRAVRAGVTTLGAVAIPVAAYFAAIVVAAWMGRDTEQISADIFNNADEWFVVFAIGAALLTPAAAVLLYWAFGSKDPGTRRAIGVVWDLVDFWPRQYHPWAPPPYTDTTIPELAARTAQLVRESGAKKVILSAHSQGAIIAVPCLSWLRYCHEAGVEGALTKAEIEKISLLTYGQLLDEHYRWLFPWIFNPFVFDEVDTFLGGRWVNLYRTTDPLGHPVRVVAEADPSRNRKITATDEATGQHLLLDLGVTTKPKTLNHGDYWYSDPEFKDALNLLSGTTQS